MNERVSFFGIDFGTTNSAVFSFTGTSSSDMQPISYGDGEGRPFPSIVAINREDGSIISGREAKDRHNTLLATHEYIASVKSALNSKKTWTVAGKTWTPENIASEIFKALKKRVELNSHQQLEEAVVAVPVGFSADNRAVLKNAARQAGITIKTFISEPTAALCSNYKQLTGCRYVAVFDWGGGTLDIAIVHIDSNSFEEIASERLDLAGDDIDIKFAEHMHSIFMRDKEHPVDFEDMDPIAKDQLLVRCEKAKCDFCDDDIVRISLNKYGQFGTVGKPVEYDHFALLIDGIVSKALECLEKTIDQSGLNKNSLDKILCVGGSSRLRPLQERLEKEYGQDLLLFPPRVMWDIAKGAALIARFPGVYSLSRSLGTLLSDDSFLPFFQKGTPLPVKEQSLKLRTTEGGAENARFVFTDAPMPSDRTFKEYFTVPLRGFFDEFVELSYSIDQDFVFHLEAGSNRMAHAVFSSWKYEKLNIRYNISRGMLV